MVDAKDPPNSNGLLGFGRKRDGNTEQAKKPNSVRGGGLSFLGKNSPLVSDTSSSSSSDEEEITNMPNQFVVECENEEMIFVTSSQGQAIKTRCRYFHLDLMATGKQIVRKPNWSVGIFRHLIELLSTGSTWIPNDETFYNQLQKAAIEVAVDARLTSLINQHDILNKISTERFFSMIDPNYLQFKIRATVKSSQWMTLMKKGILMLLRPKVLVIKVAPSGGAQEETTTTAGPSQQRLAACDSLCSEFSVYSKGNVKTLLTILDVLSPLSPEETTERKSQPEIHKLIFKTRSGSESQDDLEMLLRMTSSSYTKSNSIDEQYLRATPKSGKPSAEKNEKALVVAIEHKQKHCESICVDTILSDADSTNHSLASTQFSRHHHPRYEYRTLTGASFVVLKHLFDSIHAEHNNNNNDSTDEDMPVCLLIANPSPDKLGRFINAACLSPNCEIGFDLDDNCFFVSSSLVDINRMLKYLADYSCSAVVHEQFKLYQRQKTIL